MTLNVIINIKTLCNINFSIVLLVGSDVCVCYTVARNMYSVTNMNNISCLICFHRSDQNLSLNRTKLCRNALKYYKETRVALSYFFTLAELVALIHIQKYKKSICSVTGECPMLHLLFITRNCR